MTTEYDLEALEKFDQAWTDEFARQKGWEEHFLTDPVDALDMFFEQIPGKTMLDVGCGWGRYVHRFIEQGLDYTGMDLSQEMLAVAQASNPGLKFLQGTFRNFPFSDNQFDGLWNCCSLSAIPKIHIVSILAEHYRILRPEGVVAIMMPSLGYSEEELYTNDEGKPEIFQAHYLHKEFMDYVQQTEFKITHCEDSPRSGSMVVLMKK